MKNIDEDIKILEEEIKRVHKVNDLSGTYVPINILENLLSRLKTAERMNDVLAEHIEKHCFYHFMTFADKNINERDKKYVLEWARKKVEDAT